MQEIDYTQARARLYWLTLGIGAGVALILLAAKGVSSGAGFALGAAVSLLNLWIWNLIANRLGDGLHKASPSRIVAFAVRVLLLFALGYVIVETLNVDRLAAVCGLMTSSAAVLVEILLELTGGWRLFQ